MYPVPFLGPVIVTQYFGERHPRYTALGLAGHHGLDFALPLNTPVLACQDGEAWESTFDFGWGFYIKVRTEGGSDWLYAHLQPWLLPRPGTFIPAGSQLGFSGNSGMSTGPHLHLGYRSNALKRGWPYNGFEAPPVELPEE